MRNRRATKSVRKKNAQTCRTNQTPTITRKNSAQTSNTKHCANIKHQKILEKTSRKHQTQNIAHVSNTETGAEKSIAHVSNTELF